MKKMAMLLAAGFIAFSTSGCDEEGCHSIQNCGSLYNTGYKCDAIDYCYETKSECQADPSCE